MKEETGKAVSNDEGGDEERAEVDFLLFFASGERIHDKAGKEVGEKESDKGEPWVKKGDSDGGTEEPIAVADPFALGNEVKD